MGDLIFVIKSLVITVAIVVLLQIKIDDRTIEQHALAWIHHSPVVEQLQEVAAGAVKAGRKGVAVVSNAMGIRTREIVREEQSVLGLKVKRSAAYVKQKSREQAEAIDQELERIGSEALSTNAERN